MFWRRLKIRPSTGRFPLSVGAMGLCNSFPLLQCGCVHQRCCCCYCRCCCYRVRNGTVDGEVRTTPNRSVFNWPSMTVTSVSEVDVWRRNLTAHSNWNSLGGQATSAAELSPLLANDPVLFRIVQFQPLHSVEAVRSPAECPSKNFDKRDIRDGTKEKKRQTSPDPVVRSQPEMKTIRINPLVQPHPGLSDFWNELGHTLHFLRFRTPVMCEVSYTANCVPAARLFIPTPNASTQFSTPPASPSTSLQSSHSTLSPFAVRSSHNFIRVSSLRERSGTGRNGEILPLASNECDFFYLIHASLFLSSNRSLDSA